MTSPAPQRHLARWVLPVRCDPIPNGCVVTHSRSIQFVGSCEEAARRFPESEPVSHHDKILLPGLVNAHCHLDNGHLEGRIFLDERETFFHWIEKVVAAQTGGSGESETAARKGIAQLAGAGTVAVGDFTHGPATVSLLEEAGIEGVYFHEVTGFVEGAADSIYRQKKEILDVMRKKYGGRHYLAPHAPYSVSRELLKKMAKGRERTSFHLAESRDEVEFLLRGHAKMEEILRTLGKWEDGWSPPGLSPVRYFHELGLLREKAVAVHMVHVPEEDYPILEKTRPHICLCPRSNKRLKNGLPPVHAYREMGMNLCLGTDGLGSNDDLSLLNEMRYMKRCFPDLDDAAIVRMGTLGGALALGIEGRFGTLEAGKSDRFLLTDCPGEEAGPYSFLVC